MPNFVFPLHFVSSADVDLWANEGWDQPGCPIAVNALTLVVRVFNLANQSTTCNF
jgi:hypothetical protein